MNFPFMTAYDPPGASEGTIDPMGLYQIADQLATQLVPAVRERMQRIRFLTAMAVGAYVTEDVEADPRQGNYAPYLVWEWLVTEAMVRQPDGELDILGVPGSLVTRRALGELGYLDARSYLKTPRIFGFHGVYKRLAERLGLVDAHLQAGPNAEALVDVWARGRELSGFEATKQKIKRWSDAVRRSAEQKPPRTKPGWGSDGWRDLALAFAPLAFRSREKRHLRDLLHIKDDRGLGALPAIWELQGRYDDEAFQEERLHDELEKRWPAYRPLIAAIRAYEAFARSLQDAFDVLKARAATPDAQGFAVTDVAADADFKRSVRGLEVQFATAHQALGEVAVTNISLQNLFSERFQEFGEPMSAGEYALRVCTHHEDVQRRKSAAGKRPWFDRLDKNRIYIRHAYRESPREIAPGRYVHGYRGWPIRRFYQDLQ